MKKEIFKHSVFKNFTNLTVIQIFTYLSPLIVIPHLYKTIGLENYGLFAFSNSFIAYFTILLDFGLQLFATKEVAAHREDKLYINKLFTSIFIIKAILLLFIIVAYNLIIHFTDKFVDNVYIYYVGFAQILGFFFLPTWLYQGFEKIRPLTIVSVSTRLFFVVSIVVFIKKDSSVFTVQLFNSLTMLLFGLISFLLSLNIFKVSFVKINTCFLKQIFKKSSLYFGSRVASSMYTVSNSFILGMFYDNTIMVGIYAIAEKFYFSVQNLIQPVVNSLYPYVSHKKDTRVISKILIPSSIGFAVICLIGFFISPYLMNILVPNINEESIRVFRFLCFVLMITFPSLLLGFPVTAAIGKDRLANIPIWIAALFHMSLLAIGYYTVGLSPLKVAYCLFATETILLAMRIYIANKLRVIVFLGKKKNKNNI